jgi:hypothetical protein
MSSCELAEMLAVAIDVPDEKADFVPAPAVHQDVAEIVGARLLMLQDACSLQHVKTVPFLVALDELAVESYRVHHESRPTSVFLELGAPVDDGNVRFRSAQRAPLEDADLQELPVALAEGCLAVALGQCAVIPRCLGLVSLHPCLV